MIPQNVKDILGNVEHAGLYQTIALLLFILFFAFVVYQVIKKPKNYYQDEANLPLDDDHEEDQFKL